MQSALIVHSRHTKKYAQSISKKYRDVAFLLVEKPPTRKTLKIKNTKDVVIGIGGGSVIDAAKIIARDKRCIAVPTTAAGASMTAFATIWGNKKISVATKKPVVKSCRGVPKNLPGRVMQSTMFDALSHAIESFWSKNATSESRRYSKKAISIISRFIKKSKICLNRKEVNDLIKAGNLAGRAIAITKTNAIHAASYPLTIKYGIDHGTACGMLLPYFIEYMDYEGLPGLFSLNSTAELITLLKRSFTAPKIGNLDVQAIARKGIQYDRINDSPKKINRSALIGIMKNMNIRKKGKNLL